MSVSHWWYDPARRKYIEVSETEAWDLEEANGTIKGTQVDKIQARGGHMAGHETNCSVKDCKRTGSYSDKQGNLHCKDCWEKYRNTTKMCDYSGCLETGLLTDAITQKSFCADHIWRSNRNDGAAVISTEMAAEAAVPETEIDSEHGLTHMPGVAKFIPAAERKLDDVCTRYQVLSDLLDYLGDGLLAVTNSLVRYKNDFDYTRQRNLEGSIKLVQVYMERLGEMDRGKWEMNKVLDQCVPAKDVLEAIRKERIDRLGTGNDTKMLEGKPKPPEGSMP